MESCPLPALLGPVLRSSELSPSHSPGPPAGPRSLTVEGDTGEPLEQGDASAQLLCLRAGPPQLRSIASATEAEPSPQEAGRLRWGEVHLGRPPPCHRFGLHPRPALTPLPAAPWRRLARSVRCPGPHLPHPLPWRPAGSPGVRVPGWRHGGVTEEYRAEKRTGGNAGTCS